MKSNAHRPFVETLWNHYRWVPVGRPYAVPVYEHISGYGKAWAGQELEQDHRKEEHWGRKETCRRCQRARNMGDFENFPTFLGFAFMVLVLAVAVAVGTFAF